MVGLGLSNYSQSEQWYKNINEEDNERREKMRVGIF